MALDSAKAAAVRIDPALVPFSRYGSYLAVSRDPWDTPLGEALYLRSCHGKPQTARPELFRLDLLAGRRKVPADVLATPSVLRMQAGPGREVQLCLTGTETVLVRGRGIGLQMEVPPQSGRIVYPTEDGRWVLVPASGPNNYVVACVKGALQVDAPWKLPAGRGSARCPRMRFRIRPDADGASEARVDAFVSCLPAPEAVAFDDALAEAERDFADWLKCMPTPQYGSAADWARAAYIDWASVVPPGGLLRRPAMLMSKAHMRSVWSWDHCFNAMALSYGHPRLAWDQLMLLADFQDGNGFMPDSVNDARASWHHGKPPVHGWALAFCMRRRPRFFTRPRVERAYRWLVRWTNWWLGNRIWRGLGLPYYTHGNDSGWDNATIFDVGSPTASPDLAAHLSVQMDVLAKLAKRLGKPRAAKQWRTRSDAMLGALLAKLWRGDRFVGIHCPSGRDIECESLITSLPIVLGRRLPPAVIRALVRRIRRCAAAHGLATEDPASDQYDGNFHAYWRGSAWAPSTMLVVDGLRSAGAERLSRRIARAACRAMAKCRYRENWDPLTGGGRMELAYTWTSSVYLILAHEFV